MANFFTGTNGCFYELRGRDVYMYQTLCGKQGGQKVFENSMTIEQFRALSEFLLPDSGGRAAPVPETKPASKSESVAKPKKTTAKSTSKQTETKKKK